MVSDCVGRRHQLANGIMEELHKMVLRIPDVFNGLLFYSTDGSAGNVGGYRAPP
ncbi:hypothetical protein GDO81_028642 [Engystomops pustulosus]|uniref:Uncharacterized protein n=1 Tax=Engystomops pustulosus TaxID=76066 RepID=A0AAV6YEE2_ENGPU|nr:hypothetical protein GDO81_028642 [Engystomops pustulosus]